MHQVIEDTGELVYLERPSITGPMQPNCMPRLMKIRNKTPEIHILVDF
jgi:hypothetical protein